MNINLHSKTKKYFSHLHIIKFPLDKYKLYNEYFLSLFYVDLFRNKALEKYQFKLTLAL